MDKQKTEAKKTLTFDNTLVGKVSIDRQILVKNLETEHRSYANFPNTIIDSDGDLNNSFFLPELDSKYPAGFKLGLVVYLPDNAKGTSKKKKMSL